MSPTSCQTAPPRVRRKKDYKISTLFMQHVCHVEAVWRLDMNHAGEACAGEPDRQPRRKIRLETEREARASRALFTSGRTAERQDHVRAEAFLEADRNRRLVAIETRACGEAGVLVG